MHLLGITQKDKYQWWALDITAKNNIFFFFFFYNFKSIKKKNRIKKKTRQFYKSYECKKEKLK